MGPAPATSYLMPLTICHAGATAAEFHDPPAGGLAWPQTANCGRL
jgi:hypothetical protein